MDWENERYVRAYTRDTADLLAIGWEGRTTLWEMLRKADRAGIVEGDIEVLPELLRLPAEVVRTGLKKMLQRGVAELGIVEGADCFVLPNFIEAQEAKQSDKQRQRESRGRRRDAARGVTKCDNMTRDEAIAAIKVAPTLAHPHVTERDAESHDAGTERDEMSHDPPDPPPESEQNVTPSLAVPSLAVPDLILSNSPSRGDQVPTKKIPEDVASVWEAFEVARKQRYPESRKLTPSGARMGNIRARLKDFGQERVMAAMAKFFDSRFHWASCDDAKNPELLFRSVSQFEKVENASPWNGSGPARVSPLVQHSGKTRAELRAEGDRVRRERREAREQRERQG
ncbi:MAG: hypothetical protein V3W41_22305 [Planctomycetota bacterium]